MKYINYRRWIGWTALGFFLLITGFGSYYTVDQTQTANVRQNAAIAAENQLRTKQFEAQQVAATAKGHADATIEKARGQAEAVRLNAEANKTRLMLESEGLAAQIKPFGTSEQYVAYLQVTASLR